jgi:drug/metabolite transporter (DMT)-like permease
MIGVVRRPAAGVARSLPMTRTTGLLLAAGTATISGISVFVNATAVKHVPDPAVFTTLKNTVALVALVTLAGLTVRPSDVRDIRRSDRVRMTIIGIVGGGLAFLLFFSGLALASAPTAAFIHKTMFIWVALMAGPILGERLGWIPVAALGVLLAGQALILPPLGISWGVGETLIALATLLWTGEVILAKQVLGRVRSPIVGVARLGIGLLVLLGFLVVTGRIAGIAALTGLGWAWVTITGLLLFGYVATWLAALRRAPATEVTSILVAGALVTGTLTAMSVGALPQPPVIGGFALVALAAVALAVIGTRRPLATLDT